MAFVAAPQIVKARGIGVGGTLLVNRECSIDPLHLTLVGSKSDSKARALFVAAMKVPHPYRRLEWYDPAIGPLPNADVQYPKLPRPALFICTGSSCSSPLFTPAAVRQKFQSPTTK